MILEKEEKYNEALKSFQKIIEIYSEHYPALWKIGIMFGKLGDIEKEVECYNEAIKIEPSFADPYYNLGLAYEKKGLYKDALDKYYKACELDIFFRDAAESYTKLKEKLDGKNE